MKIYELHTNESKSYVQSTDARLRRAMFEYIQVKRSEGYPLADIVFCWAPLQVDMI
jgi:hypothetical protein